MKASLLATALAIVGAASPAPVLAQSYPIDCAILLCLAGGWPASVPCARARAEFIRRITPWPVEPPLQIWNCPMHAAFRPGPEDLPAARLYEVVFDGGAPRQSLAIAADASAALPIPTAVLPEMAPAMPSRTEGPRVHPNTMLQLAQAAVAAGGTADIDISGSAFDFVRSIKVWHVEYRHHENRNGDCNETDRTLLGSYGLQGDYRWTRGSAHAAPAWMGIDTACTKQGGMYRGVGVEWVDHQGNAGHEMVRY